MLLSEQQDSSYICLVMVKGVQLRRGHVKRSLFGETVIQSVVQRQQVHIVHRQVVGVVPTLQVTHINQRCPVESGRRKEERKWSPFRPELQGWTQSHL